MKYQIVFAYNSSDVMNGDYIDNAIEWSFDNDIEQFTFAERLQDLNPDADPDFIEFIGDNAELLNGAQLLGSCTYIGEPYRFEDGDDCFCDGVAYAIDVEIPDKALNDLINDALSEGIE